MKQMFETFVSVVHDLAKARVWQETMTPSLEKENTSVKCRRLHSNWYAYPTWVYYDRCDMIVALSNKNYGMH